MQNKSNNCKLRIRYIIIPTYKWNKKMSKIN